ncbi:uncharacterized protein LOC107046855 isoform X2 [Diachasma alloeum]|uniref:uncharacterized protein LOC107046855 isoform X2 n=1 Tax=Diachasma alloeum TaxID=454923 RepID=UPI0007384D12|nr:uncharacterized protein LOC107046855 isoform X2 [Diachasma alloeum]
MLHDNISEIMELAHSVENSAASKGMEGRSWMEKFKAMSLLNRFRPSSLISLMTYYARNIQPIVNECQTSQLQVEKLKDSMSETLLFFLYCYRAQKEETECAAYMDTMSDLLAMYIDMELKASKRSSEAQTNISARLISYLYICLDKSPQHLMDTFLKVQFLSSTYQQILDPLIERILNKVPEHPTCGVMYVRYFLIYRIWRRINKGSPVKNDITVRARKSLRSSPSTLPEYLIDNVLPKVPNTQKITTEILLTQKFDLERSAENFLKFVKESWDPPLVEDSEATKTHLSIYDNNQPEDKSTVNSNISNQSNDILSNSIIKLNTDKLSPKTQILPRRIPKKLGEVVLIDLTTDDTNGRVSKLKKSGRRLSWLQEVAKRKITNNISKEDSTIEDFRKLNLSLFLTTDGTQSMIIEEHQETETSALGIDSLSLTERPETIELEPSDELKVSETDDNVNPSLQDISASSNNDDCKITMDNETIESEIKVQIEVQNELEVTTEINELKCEDNITEMLRDEIIDDTNSASTNFVIESQRDTVLHINHKLKERRREMLDCSPEKIANGHFQELPIDGLSLLAIVSQNAAHLSTTTTSSDPSNANREIIKVKDYRSLTELGSVNEMHQPNNAGELSSSTIPICPNDDIDEVALQIEVSSSEDVEKLPTDEDNECPNSSADSSMQSEREEPNVILSGETVFLYQKSPNSNLYIINKAVENREGEEGNNMSDKVAPMEGIDEANYPYEIYEKMYRIPQPAVPQTFDDPRRAQKVKVTTSSDTGRAIDLQKTAMKKTVNSIEVKSPRRHRIRQEFNGCPSDLVDPHSIHIPATTSLYHANYPTSELYISCRQNCSSVTCAIPVNQSAPPMHSHQNSLRCTCLNCPYDIVTHFSQCIIPPGEAQPTSGIDGVYYIGIQPSSVLQDCSLKTAHETDVKPFDEKPLYKIEIDNEIDNNIQETFGKTDVNRKLPLKKRFSMMSTSFGETSVKTEKPIENYPNIPMIFIAALEPTNDMKLSPGLNNHQIHSTEIIRRDYEKDLINGYHFNDDRKRKQCDTSTPVPIKARKPSTESRQISRPSKKVQEPKSPTKNSKRQTRLLQRKAPRVNYCYDDNERNPSCAYKRKRKSRTR